MRVLRSQRPLEDRERAAVERLGFVIAALELVQDAQPVEQRGDLKVIGAESFLGEGEGAGRRTMVWLWFGIRMPASGVSVVNMAFLQRA